MKPTHSGDSFFTALSRRIDSVGPILSKVALAASATWILIALFGFIIPNSDKRYDLEERLRERQEDVATKKSQAMALYDYIDALEDPYSLYQIVQSRYGWVPTEPKAS